MSNESDEAAASAGLGSALRALMGDLGQRPTTTVKVPIKKGVDADVTLWALTQREENDARKAAYKFIKDELAFSEVELAWDEQRAINDAIVVEVLWRAMRHPQNKLVPFSTDANELRDFLGTQVLQGLFIEYVKWNKEQAWLLTVEDPVGELDKLVDHMGKARPVEQLLSRYDTTLLRQLLPLAVNRLLDALNLNSKATSSSNE